MKTLVAAVLVLVIGTSSALARKWTDSTGTHTVEAAFVDAKEGKVTLRKGDGTIVTVPIEKLSESDRHFVAQMQAGDGGKGGDAKPVTWNGWAISVSAVTVRSMTQAQTEMLLTNDGFKPVASRETPLQPKKGSFLVADVQVKWASPSNPKKSLSLGERLSTLLGPDGRTFPALGIAEKRKNGYTAIASSVELSRTNPKIASGCRDLIYFDVPLGLDNVKIRISRDSPAIPLLIAAADDLPISGDRQGYLHKETGLVFPDNIAAMKLSIPTDFEKDSPGLGVGLSYRADDATLYADVYIYDRSVATIPSGASGAVLSNQFARAIGDVRRYHPDMRFLTDQEETTIGGHTFLTRKVAYSDKGTNAISYLYLTGIRGHFLKFRVTLTAATLPGPEGRVLPFLATVAESIKKIRDVPTNRYDERQFAGTVQKSYYEAIAQLFSSASSDTSQGRRTVPGVTQWKRTHNVLRERLSQEVSQVDPGFATRDAYIRAMIDLYQSGPKPVGIDALISRARALYASPDLLPEHMDGHELILREVRPNNG